MAQQPEIMGGKPCIRGMRVTVGMIVGQIGAGHTIEEVSWQTTHIWNVKIYYRLYVMRHGGQKSARSLLRRHETSCQHLDKEARIKTDHRRLSLHGAPLEPCHRF
jgi:hypothetical protein